MAAVAGLELVEANQVDAAAAIAAAVAGVIPSSGSPAVAVSWVESSK